MATHEGEKYRPSSSLGRWLVLTLVLGFAAPLLLLFHAVADRGSLFGGGFAESSGSLGLTGVELDKIALENARLRQELATLKSQRGGRILPGLQLKDGKHAPEGNSDVMLDDGNLDLAGEESERKRRLEAELALVECGSRVKNCSGCMNQALLPPETYLLLPELPLDAKIDLSAPTVASARPFSLYHEPSTRWLQNSRRIIRNHKKELANAHKHVQDPAQRTTIVTALLDLGRGKLRNVGQFKRSFDTYIQRFQRTVDVNYPMVVFMDAQHVSSLNFNRHSNGVVVVPFSVTDLEKHFEKYHLRIEEIRNSSLYKKQAKSVGWLADAPQAALKHYNLLVMTKVFFLRWASQINPHRTQYHLFVDAGHDCVGALKIHHMDFMRKMMGRIMVTFFDYRTGMDAETHGMPNRAYRKYIGPPFDNNEGAKARNDGCCKVVRGGIFGGTPAYIDVFAEIYNELWRDTLNDGYMGTEENLFGILLYRFPSLFNAYHNHDGDNCRLFVDACEKASPDTKTFVHGDEHSHWDSEKRAFVKDTGSYTDYVTADRKLRG